MDAQQMAEKILELDIMKTSYHMAFNKCFELEEENKKLKDKLAQHDRLWHSQENLIKLLMEMGKEIK
jgi:hypothetical protein